MVDLEKNEIRTGGEEIPLFSASAEDSKLCSVLAKEKTIIPVRSECLIQGVPEASGKFRYAVTDFPSQVSQKGILVAATLVDLKKGAIPVRVLNLDHKPKTIDKGAVIATCEPVVDIVARPQEFFESLYLTSIFENLEGLNEEQRTAVKELLQEFQNLFSTSDSDVGRCNMTQHRINTGNHPPIKKYPRCLPLAKKEEAERLVKEMVDNGIIEESSGPWASPIVLVKKKDGSTRFCVDYRKLNEITIKDSYPLPRIDNTLDALNGSQWFSTLDLKSGYWQVEIQPQDKEKTDFTTGQGLWQFKWESEDGSSCRWQLILPKSRIQEVLRETHDSASGGHFGVMKTLSKTRERFYWDRLCADVEKWCRECHACGARKGPKRRTKGRLQRYNVGAPFERMVLDILGPLSLTTKGNRYVLVLMDYFTKLPEAIPIPDQEASTVAEELVRAWISRYGVPMILHSDQGTNFNSALFTELCKLLGILKTRKTALHPESDVERFNRTILSHLSLFVSKNQTDWDTHSPLFLLAYWSADHEVTGCTPADMLFCRTLRLPCDILFGRPSDAPSSPNEYLNNLEARLESVHAFARERIKLASERMKTRYDSGATGHHFKEGDQVWMYNPKRRRGLSPKLQHNWEGPYTIVKKLNDVIYRVQRSPNAKPKVIHINRLTPYWATDHSSV
ncbi:Retrovirus-related Pol polyprotein from transposon 412 [Araneus ventricosus]|uniref:RNA-directed DNA polymerase n=1 Tax=Araneus ventricosus TaxID=182803 RepID=A0A4Y2FII5_ARAVE|nr:Retrovirus-related Pol polyprotein from transposon 412 [Araneus ventricosus]